MSVNTPKKFTPEELKEVKDLQDEFNKITFQFGQFKISKISLEKQEVYLNQQYSSLESKEKELAKKYTDKYGKGNLDIESGEFNSIE
tara:strand:+ start:221 stop:481 length:261 start_codon:yes stop_codon:yes gene_type:complete